MKNKIIFFIFVVLFFATFAPASVYARETHVTVYTDVDSSFHFIIAVSLMGSWWDDGTFDITTNNLSGTSLTDNISDNPPGYQLAYYYIEEKISDDYKLAKVECYCDYGYHPPLVFSYSNNRVYISPQNTSSLECMQNFYCDFYNEKIRTPVLIVPGIGGTEIKKGNELLWIDIMRMFFDRGDSFLDPLAFNFSLDPTDDGVTGANVIKSITGFDYTDGLINEFANQGYVEGETLFMFPYDWRYGVSGKYVDGETNSDLLGEKIQQILTQTGAAKVDVVAHSMGGLIVKKYVADNPTLQKIGKAVFVGVPNTGAPDAVKGLIQGDNFGISFGPVGLNDAEMKKLAENMSAVYDLLPSQKYYNTAGSFVRFLDNTADSSHGAFSIGEQTIITDLNYDQSKAFLISDNNLNLQALTSAEGLHTQTFDDFDMRTAGVDLYAIDGCKTATMVKFAQSTTKNIFGQTQISYAPIELNTGDGTVPVQSSTNLPIDQDKKYYVLTGAHSKLLSQDGSRQEIVNLISGSDLAVNSNSVTQDVSQCQLNGKAIEIFSPVDISVKDQNGNELKLVDGNVTNEIPNANFEVWGDHKFVYLPDDAGQNYIVNLQGTGAGTYTINVQDISNSKISKTEVFSQLPVTADLTGQINLSGSSTTLSVKENANAEIETILPSEVLDYSADKTAPEGVIQFDAVKNDIKFSGTDNLSAGPAVNVNDLGGSVILTDEAGNTTEIILNEQNRKSQMTASIKAVKYNGVLTDIGRNTMKFTWGVDRKTGLAKLSQLVKSGNGYTITATFDGKNTVITGKDASGTISQTFSGLKLLKVSTSNGNLQWSY